MDTRNNIRSTNEFLKRTRRELAINGLFKNPTFLIFRPTAICADGFSVSIQASKIHYCYPRTNNAEKYETVELGFPNRKEELIMSYAEDPDNPTESVYADVPVDIVDQILEKHGGIVL